MHDKMMSRNEFVKSSATAALGAIAACAMSEVPSSALGEEAAGSTVPGQVYTSTVRSIKGDMRVAVLISNGTISQIDVMDCADSPVISDTAITDVSQRIIENQNIEVDVSAGATFTSKALCSAVSDCIEQAGLDVSAYQKGSDFPETKGGSADQDYDIVIVGSGFAGYGAAIKAVREGVDPSRVVVLEKQATTGGCSRVMGGCACIVNGTPYNKDSGYDCTLEEFEKPILERGCIDEGDIEFKKDLISKLYESSGDMFTYYSQNDFPMDIEHNYRTLPCDWNWADNIPCFSCTGHDDLTWERDDSGVLDAVEKMADGLGVETRTNAKVVELVADGKTVTGVHVEERESSYIVNAKKVILATGGFQQNQDLMEKYNSPYSTTVPFAPAGNTGDGITMTEPFDVPVVGVGGCICFVGMNPTLGYYGPIANLCRHSQIVFDKNGYVLGYGEDVSTDALIAAEDSCGYGIIDGSSVYCDRCEEAYRAGYLNKFYTLDELAQYCEIDPAAVASGCGWMGIAMPPFYLIPEIPMSIETIPGLKVDSSCHVLDSNGDTIENLYATGMLMFGNLFEDLPDDPGTGSHVTCWTNILTATCTGAIAAEDAASSILG